jgi:hypothetical protein
MRKKTMKMPKAQGADRSATQQRASQVDRGSVQRDYQARQRGASREAARPSSAGARRR